MPRKGSNCHILPFEFSLGSSSKTESLVRNFTMLLRMETTTHSYLKDAFEIIATLCGEGKIEFLFDCRGYKMGVKRFGQKGDYKSLFVFGRKIPGCRMVFKTFSEDSINRYGLTALTTDDLYFIYANLKSIISSVNEVIIDRLEGGQ